MVINRRQHVARYAGEGVRVEAEINRRWMRAGTPHVEYTFLDARGRRHTEAVTMYPDPWSKLQGQTVLVEYLSSEPNWSRLVEGEDQSGILSPGQVIAPALGALICGALCIARLLGFRLTTENGLTLTRYGNVVWARSDISPDKPRGKDRERLDVDFPQ